MSGIDPTHHTGLGNSGPTSVQKKRMRSESSHLSLSPLPPPPASSHLKFSLEVVINAGGVSDVRLPEQLVPLRLPHHTFSAEDPPWPPMYKASTLILSQVCKPLLWPSADWKATSNATVGDQLYLESLEISHRHVHSDGWPISENTGLGSLN